jgi:hypothetical protein
VIPRQGPSLACSTVGAVTDPDGTGRAAAGFLESGNSLEACPPVGGVRHGSRNVCPAQLVLDLLAGRLDPVSDVVDLPDLRQVRRGVDAGGLVGAARPGPSGLGQGHLLIGPERWMALLFRNLPGRGTAVRAPRCDRSCRFREAISWS